DVFRGRAAGTLKLTVMSSVIGFYYGAPRRLTQYRLVYNERTWKHKRLDVGTVYLDPEAVGPCGSGYSPYLDCHGNVIAGPLNGAGGKAGVGNPPAVNEYDVYQSIVFADILRT